MYWRDSKAQQNHYKAMKNNKKRPTKESAKISEMETQKKVQNILAYFAIVFSILFMLSVTIWQANRDISLDRNLKYGKAVITEFGVSGKGKHYLNYEFVVDGKKYQGSGVHYPHTDTLSVGDTIEIFYDETSPRNNIQFRSYRPSSWSGDNRRHYTVPVDTNLFRID